MPNVEGTLIDNTIRKAHAYILNGSATLNFVQQGSDTYTDYPINYNCQGNTVYPTPAFNTKVDFSLGYPQSLLNTLNGSNVANQAFIDAVTAFNLPTPAQSACNFMKQIKSMQDAYGMNNNYIIAYEGFYSGTASPDVPQGSTFNPNPTNLDQFGVGGIGTAPSAPSDSGGGGGAYDSSGTLSTGK